MVQHGSGRGGSGWRRAGTALAVTLLLSAPAAAQTEGRWALIVSGASGGEKYAEQLGQWRQTLRSALVDRYGFDAARVRVLVDEAAGDGTVGSAANVRAALADIRKAAGAEDLVLLVLLGHGTFDGEVAKFNLVGPDLTAQEWNQLLGGLPGRLVIVNTTSASYPFLDALKARGRVVITATNSAAQKYHRLRETRQALSEASTDLDKNGRTSILEVFEATSLAVTRTTSSAASSRPSGRCSMTPATAPGANRAPRAPMVAWPGCGTSTPAGGGGRQPELAALLRQQRALETEAESLKQRRDDMPAADWQAA